MCSSVGVLEAHLIGPTVCCGVIRVEYHFGAPVASQSNKLCLSGLLYYCKFKIGMASMSRTGKAVNLMVEEVLSKCTVFTFLCLTLAFLISINFTKITGTSVQKNFFLDM